MNNFVILAKNMEELKERMTQFFKIAEKHNLYFKRSKCDFNMEEIPILEVIVGKGQVQIENNKVKAVKKWKTLTKIKKVESFLGFANFYRRFIRNFSHITRPLNEFKRQKRVEIGRRTAESIWGVKRKDNKSTGSCSSKKRGKFSSRNWYIRTHNRSSLITGTRWKMETYHILIKNNATSRTKLWDIQQEITYSSRSHYKMETILIGCPINIWSLDRSWKSQVFQRATQT